MTKAELKPVEKPGVVLEVTNAEAHLLMHLIGNLNGDTAAGILGEDANRDEVKEARTTDGYPNLLSLYQALNEVLD